MKILIITKTRTGGGTEKHIAEISSALNRRSFSVDIVYTEDGFWQLYRQIYKNRYDIVHFFLPRPYLLGSIACELAFQHNRIMSRRSLTNSYQKPWIRVVEQLLHMRTCILVGNSPAVVDELRQEAPKADIRLIRNGVTIKPLPRTASTTFIIVCVANAFEYKGHKDLIGAINRIGPGLPEPWQLLLVGRDTEKFTGWRIKGLGYRTDIAEILSSASLFILPSHEEGCSNVLLEAMACEVPVIATNVGGNTDIIIPGQTGLLVPPHSPAKLALAIQSLAMAPAMRYEMAKAAQLNIANRFSFDRCVDDYEALYRSALEGA